MAIYNKGTGAGGSKTNENGIAFENKTNNYDRLITNGFVRKTIEGYEKSKYGYYLQKTINDITIIFLCQNGLKYYMKKYYDKVLIREVDEAYIVINNLTNEKYIKILEKKNQNRSGSVEDKLCLGYYFKFIEYPGCLGSDFIVDYAFCVSKYLQDLYQSEHIKWKIIRESNINNKINVFFGDEDDYFDNLDKWIFNY